MILTTADAQPIPQELGFIVQDEAGIRFYPAEYTVHIGADGRGYVTCIAKGM